jgi:CheY-like chemotaxis protein
MIRVLLADDQAVVRAGLRALLERSDDITVVGEAVDGGEAFAIAHAERPDVVLMDVRMPGVDGIEATRRIVADERLRDVRVVMLTTFDTDAHVFESIRVGAAGFLLKDIGPDELRQGIRVVAAGNALRLSGRPWIGAAAGLLPVLGFLAVTAGPAFRETRPCPSRSRRLPEPSSVSGDGAMPQLAGTAAGFSGLHPPALNRCCSCASTRA